MQKNIAGGFHSFQVFNAIMQCRKFLDTFATKIMILRAHFLVLVLDFQTKPIYSWRSPLLMIQDIYPYWRSVPLSLPDVLPPLHEAPLPVNAGNKPFTTFYKYNHINLYHIPYKSSSKESHSHLSLSLFYLEGFLLSFVIHQWSNWRYLHDNPPGADLFSLLFS